MLVERPLLHVDVENSSALGDGYCGKQGDCYLIESSIETVFLVEKYQS
jgi:hypothetical protein